MKDSGATLKKRGRKIHPDYIEKSRERVMTLKTEYMKNGNEMP